MLQNVQNDTYLDIFPVKLKTSDLECLRYVINRILSKPIE